MTSTRGKKPVSSRKKRRQRERRMLLMILAVMVLLLGALVFFLIRGLTAGLSRIGDSAKNVPAGAEQGIDSIQLNEDGSLTVSSCESFAEDYYDETELKSAAASEISSFGDGTEISIESISVENGTASMVLDYDSGASFSGFNDIPFYYGSLSGAREAGYADSLFEGMASGGLDSWFSENGDKAVVICSEPAALTLPFKIRDTEGDVVASGSRSASVGDGASEQSPAVILMNGSLKQ